MDDLLSADSFLGFCSAGLDAALGMVGLLAKASVLSGKAALAAKSIAAGGAFFGTWNLVGLATTLQGTERHASVYFYNPLIPNITTTELPVGTVGKPYDQALSVEDGTPPFEWSVIAGNLPDGLELDESSGVISGVPSSLGTSEFTVKVLDTYGASDTQDLSITVSDGSFTDCSSQSEVPKTECEALVALYNSTNGSGWTTSTDWLATSTPCSWFGVSCEGGSVSTLTLETNELTGPIPSELEDLTNLTGLLLRWNQLNGTIPPELGSLALLKDLSLGDNQLTGTIPPELGNLADLRNLRLYKNQLTGSIPADLGNLTNLEMLLLYKNQLTGTIPAEIGDLGNLLGLWFNTNQLTGSIPAELGNLTQLENLDLYENQLTGTIPPELGNLVNLQGLYLALNGLTGAIPAELGGLHNLLDLWLFANDLTSSIPAELGSLSELLWLYLYSNQLTGTIPPELGNLVNLQRLYLDRNELTGAIPAELGKLAKLERLTLDTNQLTGSIPAELGNLANLEWLYLSENQLTGVVPLSVAQLGGLMQQQIAAGSCRIGNSGNTGLSMPDNADYRAADLNGDGEICWVQIGSGGSALGTGFGAEQFALIPAGTFLMGDATGNGQANELPVHTVNITQSYYMQKTEVTQGQWRAVMGTSPSNFSSCGDDCPVEEVSWNDIQAFLTALNTQDSGKNYRLPTEAEWEYAARAGTTGDYGGTGVLDDMGWHYTNSDSTTHPVAGKQPNAWGLYDMHGNVWEWVQDWYSFDYYSVSPANNPSGPASGYARVSRGGSWNWGADSARSAFRNAGTTTPRYHDVGFRLVRTP